MPGNMLGAEDTGIITAIKESQYQCMNHIPFEEIPFLQNVKCYFPDLIKRTKNRERKK